MQVHTKFYRPFAIGVAVTWAGFLSAILEYTFPNLSVIMSTRNRPFLPGYLSSLENVDGKKRYKEKLAIIGSLDPYEIVRSEWLDDIDL